MEEFIAKSSDDSSWGSKQPTFRDRVTDASGRYFLVGHSTSGEPISVQLAAATIQPPNGD